MYYFFKKLSPSFPSGVLPAILIGFSLSCSVAADNEPSGSELLYTYTLSENGSSESYDEAMVAACLQGIINSNTPTVYFLSKTNKMPAYWLELFRLKGKWLNGRNIKPLNDMDALFSLAKKKVKSAVIWDPSVPASMNVATTIAGIENGIVLSPEMAEKYLTKWNIKVIKDLRGMFTGSETGSKKNDAYRWDSGLFPPSTPWIMSSRPPGRDLKG